MRSYMKGLAKTFLESTPRGYQLGKFIVRNTSFSLPHEDEFHAFSQIARSADGLFLDLGANDGVSARSFHKLVPHYRIHSIEANPLHAENLRRLGQRMPGFTFMIAAATDVEGGTVMLHTPTYKNIVVHSAATMDATRARDSLTAQYGKLGSSRHCGLISAETPTIRVDSLRLEPDIVKIDLEGSELQALHGMTETIARCRPYIMLEYDHETFDEISAFLSAYEYNARSFDVQSESFTDIVAGRNCFFLPADVPGV
jgi:FkbM family methyltransferase